MQMIEVESSNIDAIGFENNILIVRFMSGSVYSYSNVEPEVYESFLNSESKGKFLHQHIKGKYEYCKLSD